LQVEKPLSGFEITGKDAEIILNLTVKDEDLSTTKKEN